MTAKGVNHGISLKVAISVHLEPLTQPLIRRYFALSYRLYCLRLRASSQPQIFDLLGRVSGS